MNEHERGQVIFDKLNVKVKETLEFIELVRIRSSAREETLNKYKQEFERFLRSRGIDELQINLRNIESAPDVEGANVDYTLSEHAQVGNESRTLNSYLEEIHELIFEYRGS